jgi:hypothetical protein
MVQPSHKAEETVDAVEEHHTKRQVALALVHKEEMVEMFP